VQKRLNRKDRFQKVLDYFRKNVPTPKTELTYESGYQLIVAVILSAQCTDKRVNMITTSFFEAFPDEYSLATAKSEDVFEIIKSCSYPNNKTKNLIGMAKSLSTDFKGRIPEAIDELQQMPGVGRKTANVLASVLFNKPAMAVDTHVFRVANRIGLTIAKNPLQSEKQLVKYIPESMIPDAHHWLILHGRYICQARNPKCRECGLSAFCKYFKANS